MSKNNKKNKKNKNKIFLRNQNSSKSNNRKNLKVVSTGDVFDKNDEKKVINNSQNNTQQHNSYSGQNSTNRIIKNKFNRHQDNTTFEDKRREILKKEFLQKEEERFYKREKVTLFRKLVNRQEKPYKVIVMDSVNCELCGKPISNMSTYMKYYGKMAHFDCVFDKVKNSLTLSEKERLAYIGSNSFAIIEDYMDENNNLKFKINKKISINTEG